MTATLQAGAIRRADPVILVAPENNQHSVRLPTSEEQRTRTTALCSVVTHLDHATARWISGDHSGALGEAFRDTRVAMYQIARRIAGHDNAADIAQDVLLRIWKSQDRFDPQRGPLSQYLRLTTRGVSIDFVRGEVARKNREDGATSLRQEMSVDITEDYLDRERARQVVNAVNSLRTIERAPIIDAFYHHRPYREIAANTGLSEGTVKSRIRAGLMRLRAELRTTEPTIPKGEQIALPTNGPGFDSEHDRRS